MKTGLIAIALALCASALTTVPFDAEARRLGGGKAAGMQRQAAPPRTADAPPATPAPSTNPAAAAAAPTAGAAAGAAAGARRSWMGPIAGLAAGLGIAALLSHFGMGEGLANMITLLLVAALAFFAIRWLMRRMAASRSPQTGRSGLQFAGAGAPADAAPVAATARQRDAAGVSARESLESPSATNAFPAGSAAAAGTASAAPSRSAQPEGFDASAFERIAKMIFIRLQAANDAGELDDLRRFTTPELFASLRLDLQDRGEAPQQTDVVQLDAEVRETAKEDGQWIVTVRFHGLIREQPDAPAEPFDELWHLVKPIEGQRDWAIAGIAQTVH